MTYIGSVTGVGPTVHWFDTDSGFVKMSQDLYDEWLTAMGEKKPKPVTEEPYKKCECGSDSAGSSRHAYYCPKYEK